MPSLSTNEGKCESKKRSASHVLYKVSFGLSMIFVSSFKHWVNKQHNFF
jgi:hypothetical protein